jgi:hypothetical protein
MRDFIGDILGRLTVLAYAAGIGIFLCAAGLQLLCSVFGRCLVANPVELVWVSVAMFAASVVFMLLADRV